MCLFCGRFLNILLQLLYHVFQFLIPLFKEMYCNYRLIFGWEKETGNINALSHNQTAQ